MIIPLGTDAPIYHWPFATVALILLNIVAFIVAPPDRHQADTDDMPAAVSDFDRYALSLGNGLHPVQWVTHNFLHIGIGHLAGNIVFLWAFGIAVEGKLGWWKYLLVYLVLGTLHGALSQTLMLRLEPPGHAVGASAVVYGMLAMCMIWCPRNELNCIAIFIFGFRVRVWNWNLRYTTVALIYFGAEVISGFWHGAFGRDVVRELGHLSGAFWGTMLAAAMVKTNLVDCEGWDVFSLLTKNKQLAKDWKRRGEMLDRKEKSTKAVVAARYKGERDSEADPEVRAAAALRKVRKLIEMGDVIGAVAAYDKSARTLVRWPAEADLYELIKSLHARKADPDSIPLMRDFCRYFPDAPATPRMRLKLAQVLIRDRQRPTNALRVLAEIAPEALTPELESAHRKLTNQAMKMQADGVLELEGDD